MKKRRPSAFAESIALGRRRQRALQNRVARLEDEVQELRRLHRRVAEIADVVQEVLVPAANRDDERIRRLLDDYSDAL